MGIGWKEIRRNGEGPVSLCSVVSPGVKTTRTQWSSSPVHSRDSEGRSRLRSGIEGFTTSLCFSSSFSVSGKDPDDTLPFSLVSGLFDSPVTFLSYRYSFPSYSMSREPKHTGLETGTFSVTTSSFCFYPFFVFSKNRII